MCVVVQDPMDVLDLSFAGASLYEVRGMVFGKIVQLDKVTFRCTDCEYQSNRRANVARHVEGHHITNISIACAYCSQMFASSNALNTHVSRKHRNSK